MIGITCIVCFTALVITNMITNCIEKCSSIKKEGIK